MVDLATRKPKHPCLRSSHETVSGFVVLSLLFCPFVEVMAIDLHDNDERENSILRMHPGAYAEIGAKPVVLWLSKQRQKPARPATYFPVVILGLRQSKRITLANASASCRSKGDWQRSMPTRFSSKFVIVPRFFCGVQLQIGTRGVIIFVI